MKKLQDELEKEKDNNQFKYKIKQLEKNIKEKEDNFNQLSHLYEELLSKYHLPSGEKILRIKIQSIDQNIDYSIISKEDGHFSRIEQLIYNKYPEYKNKKNYFFGNGHPINKNKTLKDNKLKNNDIILIDQNEFSSLNSSLISMSYQD